jgi:hypothetical protein
MMYSSKKMIGHYSSKCRLAHAFIAVCGLLLTLLTISFKSGEQGPKGYRHLTRRDSLASKKAFMSVYAVLMSPRCMNCHPSGDIPLQGEDSHLHAQGVKRGLEGKGLYALKCKNCHQDQNLPGLHMPPGNPKWGLPPARMRMVFQGRTAGQLAKQLLDRKQNGGKSVQALVRHITQDGLVLTGWTPADGLAKPPLSHQQFVQAFNEWINKGAVAP